MADQTSGRTLAATTNAAAWLEVEAALGLTTAFGTVDAVALALATRLLSGKPVLHVERARSRASKASVAVQGLTSEQTAWINSRQSLGTQQQRGAWWLPEEVSLDAGVCNLPALLAKHGDYGLVSAGDSKVKIGGASPDGMLTWALLEPLAMALLAPLLLRGPWAANKADVRRQAWQETLATYQDLGLADTPAGKAASRIGPDGDWRGLTREQRQALRLELLQGLRGHVTLETVQRLRARQLAELVGGLYAKAKPVTTMPLARTVMTKARQPYLSAWFAGDWVAFLTYLGESPNPGEQLAAQLPAAALIVAEPGQTVQVAEQTGLSADAVNDILRAYVGSHAGTGNAPAVRSAATARGAAATGTPVHDRVQVLSNFFQEFDALHARQQPGMQPLWGLVDEGLFVVGDPSDNARRYRQLLTPELTARIDHLWEGTCLPRYPDRVVSEMHPHKQMADAAGPALTFWNGVALTCWYICEGPYSRTGIAGLAEYHARELAALGRMNLPVDPALFEDLRQAEKRLGREMPIQTAQHTVERGGLTLTVTTSSGTRRNGFEHLRDVVTKHRQAWLSQNLTPYLELRWRSELESVFREFQRLVVTKGKPPTHKQFAGFAATAANHWFNGDLTGLYAALGEKPPASTRRIDQLPGDVYDISWTVYSLLGGTPFDRSNTYAHPETYGTNWELGRIAALVPKYIQLQEALDRLPTAKELGGERIKWPWPGGESEGMRRLSAAIAQGLIAAEARSSQIQPQAVRPPTPTPPATPPQAVAAPLVRDRKRPGLLDRLRRR